MEGVFFHLPMKFVMVIKQIYNVQNDNTLTSHYQLESVRNTQMMKTEADCEGVEKRRLSS